MVTWDKQFSKSNFYQIFIKTDSDLKSLINLISVRSYLHRFQNLTKFSILTKFSNLERFQKMNQSAK